MFQACVLLLGTGSIMSYDNGISFLNKRGILQLNEPLLHSILQSLMQLHSSVFTLVHVSATLGQHQVLLLIVAKALSL
jgi:hypothetical protein